MIIEYLVMKLALQAVVDECNRLALVQESQERVGFLKSRIARLEVAYDSGLIDGEESFPAFSMNWSASSSVYSAPSRTRERALSRDVESLMGR